MPRKSSTFGVAIVGCGTVGGAAATILTRDREVLGERLGARLELRHVVDVDFRNAERLGLDKGLFRKDLADVLADGETRVVAELIGGTTAAKDVIARSLSAGKHAVTANKALLAHFGPELFALARRHGVCIGFEASCAGGIPIVRALYDGLIANRIDAMYGIVNGTCNHILTAMTEHGRTYAEALAEAQQAGLAEADPTLDVSGGDSAHKLAILAALAFGRRVDFGAIPVEGIDELELCDIEYGRELGYVIKLLAIAHRQPEGLSLRVRPSFIPKDHPLAWIAGSFNAISVYGHATGHTMYYGRGAGGTPTASAVVADMAALATGSVQAAFENLKIWPDVTEPACQLPIGAVRSRYYIRMRAVDRPGVLARVATIFGQHSISISSLLQHEPPPGSRAPAIVPVVVTTAQAQEGNVRLAMEEIDSLDVIEPPSVCIAIVDEHPERI
ncbi:MAG TPA: homoserine dehydrogenase [Phycisphaerae bacterium]|nr:homoserine dehydrogenase [Phycisphaerae bacterium]